MGTKIIYHECEERIEKYVMRITIWHQEAFFYSSIAIILMGKRELVTLLNLSSWCLVIVERLILAVPWGRLRFVIVVFPDHTHFIFCGMNTNGDREGWITFPYEFQLFYILRI